MNEQQLFIESPTTWNALSTHTDHSGDHIYLYSDTAVCAVSDAGEARALAMLARAGLIPQYETVALRATA